LPKIPRNVPILVLFGDNDWLYFPQKQIDNDIRLLKKGEFPKPPVTTGSVGNSSSSSSNDNNTLSNTESVAGMNITLEVVPKAGHHLYMDNAPVFHQKIIDWLKKEKKM
jgi:pimeloyl-ACP methyl ester carboxylesterase